MTYLAIVKVSLASRVEKYQDYQTEAEAVAHVARVAALYPLAFASPHPGGGSADWLCDTAAKTVVVSPPPPPPKPTAISYEAFQDRFTTAEFNAATDFVYASELATGLPKRRALIQGLSRAMAKNSVGLLEARTIAFMDALVAGGIITAERKAEILQP